MSDIRRHDSYSYRNKKLSIQFAILFSILFAILFGILFSIPIVTLFAITIQMLFLSVGPVMVQKTHTNLMSCLSEPPDFSELLRKKLLPLLELTMIPLSI